MNKIAYVKDPHLMFGFSNNIRKPIANGSGNSWEKSIKYKLEFIAKTMKDNKINILIFSGDVFDHSKRSDWSFNKWLKHKNILEEIFINQGIKIYSVQGNHDMFDGKAELDGTIFGEMVEYGIINHLTTNPLEFQTPNGLVKIFGNDYSFTKNEQKLKFSNVNAEVQNYIGMLVSHTNISPNDEHLVDFTYQELTENFPNINVHLCGHYHLGYENTQLNNITFINPWNMTRVTREYQVRMDNHTPEMILMDLDKYSSNNLDWVQTIEIPHLSFHEAFNEEVISVLKENQKFKFFENCDGQEVNLNGLINDDLDDNQLLSVIINSVLSEKSVQEKQLLLNKALTYLI